MQAAFTESKDGNGKSIAKGISRGVKEKLLKRGSYRRPLFSPSVEKKDTETWTKDVQSLYVRTV